MKLDYKKELEEAAKTMILVHNPKVLIKLIVRNIVSKVKVSHAGILLHEKDKDSYILTVSRGESGAKIPAGFARMDADNSLIRFFREYLGRNLLGEPALTCVDAKRLLKKKLSPKLKKIIKGVLTQMEIFEAVACVPTYFRNELLGILFLGHKKNKKRFTTDEMDFFIAIASDVAMAIRNAQLFAELELELEKKHSLFIHTTIALATAIDAKDHYTHGHTARVTGLSLAIAKKLGESVKGANDPKFLEDLHVASLLHDIGKIGIPESLLNKTTSLTVGERKKIMEHVTTGAIILKPIRELEQAILGVKYHHERHDGKGYPEGLKAGQIPLIASIISVADAFDAITTNRPYSNGLSKAEAAKEIKRNSGRQFHPDVAKAFVQLVREGKI